MNNRRSLLRARSWYRSKSWTRARSWYRSWSGSMSMSWSGFSYKSTIRSWRDV